MNTQPTCPDRSALERLLAGSPTDPPAEALYAHIEQCGACVRTLFDLGHGDTLPDLVRSGAAVAAVDPTAVEPLIRRILDRGEAADVTVTTPDGRDTGNETADALAVLSPPQAAGEIGRLGGYRVQKVLGQGGMGAVFQAEDPKLGRLVALKVMLPAVARKPGMKDRFLREARAAAALEHDHVVPVYEVNEANGVPYIAMPYLKGGTLADRLAEANGPLAVNEVLTVGRQIAAGLAAAHARGLVHRDVKPANVWLDAAAGGRVKILDFGLARSDADEQLTHSGAILGTPSYMAPEQAAGKPVDGRADLFSLGVVLYRMAAGRLPFRGDNTLAVLSALANDTPPPVRELNPKVPAKLADLIHRLLAKDPAARPASAERVMAELDTPTVPASGERKRRPWLPVAIAAAVLSLAGIALGVYLFKFETKDGTLVVEVDDKDADLRFQKGELQVWADGKLKYTLTPSEKNKTLPPGKYLLKVVGADGVKLETTEFEMTKGGVTTVKVTAEPPAKAVAAAELPKAATDAVPTFDGKVVFYDTFDSAEKCQLPLADGPPKREVKDGRYTVAHLDGKVTDELAVDLGPRVKAGAFAVRARAENGHLVITFRNRTVLESSMRWNAVRFSPAGAETVVLNHRNWDKTQWGKVSQSVLRSAPPDPKLAAGQWVTIAARWSETEYEVWVNGERVAGGAADPAEVTADTLPVQVGVGQTKDGPAKLELEYAAVWDQTEQPKPVVAPAADFQSETAFPGKVVFRDTFDSAEKCLLPLADGPPKREVKDGKYVMSAATLKAGDGLYAEIGPAVAAGVFAARVRQENGGLFVNFRVRGSDKGNRWLGLGVLQTGEWAVSLRRQDFKGGDVVNKEPTVLAAGSAADPALVAGKWIAVATRWSETEYEVWLNGKRVAGGPINQAELAGGTPHPLQVGSSVERDGPVKIELEYAAVWDQTGLPKPAAGGEPDFRSETAFPGKVVFRDTFDSKEKCQLPLADGPPVKKEVKDGKYVVSNPAANPDHVLQVILVSPRVKVGAFAVRARVENGNLFANFRNRVTPDVDNRWHTVSVLPAGDQYVRLHRTKWEKDRWGSRSLAELQATPADPTLAAGKWVTLAARWSETEYEVWVNGKRVAGGAADPADKTAHTSPVDVCCRPTVVGPAKLELDFATVWDQTGLPVSAVGPAFALADKLDTLRWVLSKRKPGTGNAARIVVDGKPVWLEPGSVLPAGDFTVTAVELHRMFSEPITDDDLKRIGALAGLKKLNIGAQPVTAAGLKHLKGLTELNELDIWGQSPEAAAELVRGFENKLEMMCLPGDHADEWVAALAGMPKLRFLYCTHGTLSVKGVAGLRKLPALTAITLAKMEERLDDFLPELAKNDRLRSISFDVVSDATRGKIDEFAKTVPACEIRYTHNGKEVVLPAGRK